MEAACSVPLSVHLLSTTPALVLHQLSLRLEQASFAAAASESQQHRKAFQPVDERDVVYTGWYPPPVLSVGADCDSIDCQLPVYPFISDDIEPLSVFVDWVKWLHSSMRGTAFDLDTVCTLATQ